MAAAVAAVPPHVSFRFGEASERRPHLGYAIRAFLPFSDPAATVPASLVRSSSTAGGTNTSTAATFVIELGLPFLIFCPRRLRFITAWGILLLQLLILLTGNYTFFNLLAMVLCVMLFDDAALRKVLPQHLRSFVQDHVRNTKPGAIVSFAAGAFALLIVFVSLVQMQGMFGSRSSGPARWIDNEIAPLCIVNTYGLFAVMTTARPEKIIEGSDDGIHWREYAFRYKPGDVRRVPQWNIPHQTRLDWQMWFAALGTASQSPWFPRFLQRLLENSPEVTALLGSNPFPHKPPLYVRALLYDYRYSSREEKQTTDAWWVRQPERIYYPATDLGS
jgi:lipase maturation factor 1